ncbi:DNA-binding domain-containing protein, AraC-type [Opitutaceae bacterium TAV1]|nr:DNA-binding domain-containing protein, AraC-type [Opitutaceae bacterium TAV1]
MDGECTWQKLPGNHVWIIPSGTPHALNWKRESALVVLYIEMDRAKKTSIVSNNKIRIESLRHHELVEPLIGALGHRLRQFCRQRPDADERDHAAVLGAALAHELLAAQGRSVRRERGLRRMDSSTLLRLKAYIEEHLADDLPPILLARVAAMSRSRFFEAFRQETGLTPRSYINRLRVLHARGLLQTGRYTVAEAAYASGFCDQSGIDRHFRKMLNASPRSFLPARNTGLIA